MYSNRKWVSRLMLLVFGVLALSPIVSAQSIRIAARQRSLLPPDKARDIFNAGQTFYDQDKFSEAEKRFREVVSKFPTNDIADRADYYLIRTLTQLGKRDEALARISRFAGQYPKSKWLSDVQEVRMQLTNQVPANAEYILLRPPAPPASPAPPAQPAPFVRPVQIGRGTPFSVPPTPFGPVEFQSSDPQISLQQEIMRAVFRNNPERAIEIATERLKADPADPVVLSSLNMVASSHSTQALPMLLTIARNSTNPKARRDAIFWLGQSRGDKDSIVDTLVGLIPSLAEDDAEAVAYTLGQIRTDKSLNALATIARDKNKSEKTRNNALFWIGQSRATNRVSLLEDIYKSSMDSSKTRQQVMYALSQTREPAAVTVLGNVASNDPDIEVRKQAVFWLGQNRSPEAIQMLERLLQKK